MGVVVKRLLGAARQIEIKRSLIGTYRLFHRMNRMPDLRRLFWRNFLRCSLRGIFVLDHAMRLMAIYLHFYNQSKYLDLALEQQIRSSDHIPAMMTSDALAKLNMKKAAV